MRSALLVVDVQVGVMREAWQAPRIIANVALAVARARSQGAPVIWVQHQNDELPHGSAQWQWVDELVPAAGEPVLPKRFNSAFEDTPLGDELARRGVRHVVLAGAESNWCIRATAYGALERGFDLTLVKDAHTCASVSLDDGTTIEASGVVADLNLTMTWLCYPGRSSNTAAAGQLDFRSEP